MDGSLAGTMPNVTLTLATLAIVVGPLGVWLGTFLAGRGDQDQWLRSERLKAYVDLYRASEALIAQRNEASLQAFRDAVAPAQILGPGELNRPLMELTSTTTTVAFMKRDAEGNTEALNAQAAARYQFFSKASGVLGAMKEGDAPHSMRF